MPIPIYDSGGRLMRFAEAESIIEHQHHFRLVRTRRGHLKEAHLRSAKLCRDKDRYVVAAITDSLDVRPRSNIGRHFEQPLRTGHVYALRGVIGSR